MTLQPGKDQGAIVSFTNEGTIEQGFTSDVALLRQALAQVKVFAPPGVFIVDPTVLGRPDAKKGAGATALWDTIWATCEYLFPNGKNQFRKAIVLLTDGVDTFSRATMSDAIHRATRADIAIYSIGLGDPERGVNNDSLIKLSEQTGGQAFFPKQIKDLDPIFAALNQHLGSQYRLTYRSPSKLGRSEKVRIEFTNPDLKKMRLYYQRLN